MHHKYKSIFFFTLLHSFRAILETLFPFICSSETLLMYLYFGNNLDCKNWRKHEITLDAGLPTQVPAWAYASYLCTSVLSFHPYTAKLVGLTPFYCHSLPYRRLWSILVCELSKHLLSFTKKCSMTIFKHFPIVAGLA